MTRFAPLALLALALAACRGHDDHADHDHPAAPAAERGEHGDEHGERGDEHGEHGDEHGEGVVQLAPAAVERSGIRVEPAPGGRLTATVEVPAEVQFDPDRVAHVTPLVDGQLLAVEVAIGDRVEAGQALATLRSVTLGEARATLARADAMVDVARQDARRQEKLRAAGINAERKLLEARLALRAARAERDAARSRLTVFGIEGGKGADMTLQSPIAGVVIERHATRGENVTPQDTLFVIGDQSAVRVIGRLPADHIALAHPGARATLTLPAWPGRTWTGTVDYIAAALDERTRTLPIRVELQNPDGALRPGLFGALALDRDAPDGPPLALVPRDAVQTLDDRAVVFVPGDAPGEFVATPITLGRSVGARVEVAAGLAPGAPVVTAGAFVLKSEAMRGELGHGHAH